jgi:hypothetical protein
MLIDDFLTFPAAAGQDSDGVTAAVYSSAGLYLKEHPSTRRSEM